jgi:hypothetical protein
MSLTRRISEHCDQACSLPEAAAAVEAVAVEAAEVAGASGVAAAAEAASALGAAEAASALWPAEAAEGAHPGGEVAASRGEVAASARPNSYCTTDTRPNGARECAPILSLANRLDRAWPNMKLCLSDAAAT